MARTALLYPFPALLIVAGWLSLEDPSAGGRAAAAMLVALVPALVRPWWARLATALVGAAVVLPGGLGLSSVRPGGYTGLPGRFWAGFREFYEVTVPFDPTVLPRMHGVTVVAIFCFCLALGLAIALRRPVVASLVVAAGTTWPVTLAPGQHDLLLGGLVVTAVLLLFAGLQPNGRVTLGPALVLGSAVVVVALAAASTPAVARDAFLGWQRWKLPTRQDSAVSVAYVWDSQYDGIHFPKKTTTVLRIAAPDRSVYWRATTLDLFNGYTWRESPDWDVVVASRDGRQVLAEDPSFPRAARDPRRWTRQTVEVVGLRDVHLVGASVPVAYRTPRDDVQYATGGIASLRDPTERGEQYDVWSYAPSPSPRKLEAARVRYRPSALFRGDVIADTALGRDVELADTELPPFGAPGRDSAMRRVFASYPHDDRYQPYRAVYERAREVVGATKSPYAAAVALEVWLRTAGGFRYDESPPRPPAGIPALADFVTHTKAGYCQHFAGAMALMLRLLGIPARVAAGFTSGTYDRESRVWTVTDHDAHAWVEVWFDGFGWLPFDPTPGRGALGGTYTSASPVFDASGAPTGLAKRLGFTPEALRARIQRGREASRQVGPTPKPDSGGDGVLAHAPSLLLLLLGLALVAAALVALLKLLLRRGRYATRDPRRIAAACQRELVDFLRDQRIEAAPGATLAEVNETLERRLSVSGRRFVAAASAARFAAPARSAVEATRARRELRGLLRAIRRRLTTADRVRGLLSLRSLGAR